MAFLFNVLSSTLVLNIVFSQTQAFASLSPNDPASYSTPDVTVIRHIELKLSVDFDRKVLSGYALLKLETLQNTREVILDVSDLLIESIQLENTTLVYKVDEHIPNIGSKLTIQLPREVTLGEKFNIKIKYATSPSASALQWLEPSQTKGKKFPYLFSQCSPIHARSILPCQDSPAVKFTYAAEISAPHQFTVLMSALRGNVTTEGDISTTSFRQPVPIPTNLMAIAVAVLEGRSIGPRSMVWSEKEVIDQSAYEFAETESYIQAAEKLCGPYVWKKYDLLVLPPSFPYGAMENPCLTFVTPTLLAGDRSQANVIAHEIAHSWTGNLVSIKNFEHFWLKEGWTVYLERKIRAALAQDPVEGKRQRDFFSLLGLEELTNEVQAVDVTDPNGQSTQLVVNLTGRHPEDTYGNVPYEKGSLFIRYLEDLIGIESFEAFLRSYIDHFKNKSHDSNEFKAYLIEYYKDKPESVRVAQVDWHTWLYATGMPPVIPKSMVWSEKEVIDQSAYEFAETESYIQAAEKLCGPYVWKKYDLLVLPPSFPYGAMENPCLTFVTPTLLAGDRSQANVIAHEIAHSWTGNLVSIKNFEHFWLKEGWTVYLERKIRAALAQDPVEGKRQRDFFSLLGLEELTNEVQAVDVTDPNGQSTQLVVNLTGQHPEDTYGNVPYEKGSLFIRYLEDLIGIESFEAFLRSYIDHFKNKSHDSNEFKAYLIEYYKDKPESVRVAQVDWHTWLYATGMPPVIPKYDTTMAVEVTNLLSKVISHNSTPIYDDVKHFTPHQIIYLLQQIINSQILPIDTLDNIGTAYKISDSHNTDIKYRWLRLCIQSRNSSKLPEVFEFVNSQGRTKYVRPLYRDLYAWEATRQRAIENFLENEPNMMHVTAHTIRKELHLD